MISEVGGMNSVPTISAKSSFAAAEPIRASAYAAIDAVTSMSSVCRVAASMLLTNQRSTGFAELSRICS